jgi:hypothetical protein
MTVYQQYRQHILVFTSIFYPSGCSVNLLAFELLILSLMSLLKLQETLPNSVSYTVPVKKQLWIMICLFMPWCIANCYIIVIDYADCVFALQSYAMMKSVLCGLLLLIY